MEQAPGTQRMRHGRVTCQNTKERILAASEFLLVHKGYGISIRAIAHTAGVNIAAINYYFGSKDQLIEQVFKRRFAVLDEACSRELQEMCDAGADGATKFSVSRILRTYLDPFFGNSDDMVLTSRAVMAPDRGGLQAALADTMKSSREMLLQMLCKALPDLPERVVRLRFLFSIGALGYTMVLAAGGGVPLDKLECSNRDWLIDMLVHFLCSAFEAPFVEETLANPYRARHRW